MRAAAVEPSPPDSPEEGLCMQERCTLDGPTVGPSQNKSAAHQLLIIVQVQPLLMHQRFTVYIRIQSPNISDVGKILQIK